MDSGFWMELAKAIPYAVVAFLFVKIAYKDMKQSRESTERIHTESINTIKEIIDKANYTSVGVEIQKSMDKYNLVNCPAMEKE